MLRYAPEPVLVSLGLMLLWLCPGIASICSIYICSICSLCIYICPVGHELTRMCSRTSPPPLLILVMCWYVSVYHHVLIPRCAHSCCILVFHAKAHMQVWLWFILVRIDENHVMFHVNTTTYDLLLPINAYHVLFTTIHQIFIHDFPLFMHA